MTYHFPILLFVLDDDAGPGANKCCIQLITTDKPAELALQSAVLAQLACG